MPNNQLYPVKFAVTKSLINDDDDDDDDDNQRLRSAGDNDRRSKFHVTDGQNTRDQIRVIRF